MRPRIKRTTITPPRNKECPITAQEYSAIMRMKSPRVITLTSSEIMLMGKSKKPYRITYAREYWVLTLLSKTIHMPGNWEKTPEFRIERIQTK